MRGIKGISNSSINLDEYFLLTAEISNIITSFCGKFGISESEACKREDHYQLSGSKNSRIRSNVSKISDVFSTYGVSFDATGNVYNVLTMKVLPKKNAEQFLTVKKIGKESYANFVKKRIEDGSSILNNTKKIKIPCFTNNNKSTYIELNGETLQIRQERKLMNRILVASRSRPETDLSNIFSTYEFSVVPLSLSATDGSLYYGKEKSVIAKELREFESEEIGTQEEDSESRKVIIIDAMAILNKIDIKSEFIENCAEFASTFCKRVKNKASKFDEVRIIFDRYDVKSVKANTRAGRIKGIAPVQYKVTDSMRIRHLETKKFLASIETKRELTRYLADKLAADLEKDFVVVLDSCFSNLADLEESLRTYGQEEADAGIVLHAIDVCRRDPFSELTISCSHTDVLLILLNYFEQLPSTTIFKTTEHCYNLRQIFERFTPRVCKALLGLPAFTGRDQTGKFHGFSKRSCWEIFTSSTNETINPFINLGINDLNPGTH